MIKSSYIVCIFYIVIIFTIFNNSLQALANQPFIVNVPCINSGKYCTSSGARIVDGVKVHRDCWEYAYTKKCNYPSKNNCSLYEHCYAVGNRECLLKDSLGNCVNVCKLGGLNPSPSGEDFSII
jgi:hypothetical protein